MAAKQTYHHGDLRRAMIDAAIALIAEDDVKHLSLRGVARRVGVSHTAPYRHFADKEALLAAVAEEGFVLFGQYLQKADQQAKGNALQRLEAIGVAYVRYATEHPTHYRVMFGPDRVNNPGYPSLMEASQRSFATLVNVITEGQMLGILRSGDPQHLAWGAWSLVHGLSLLLIDGQLPISKDGKAVACHPDDLSQSDHPDHLEAIVSMASSLTHLLVTGLKSDNGS